MFLKKPRREAPYPTFLQKKAIQLMTLVRIALCVAVAQAYVVPVVRVRSRPLYARSRPLEAASVEDEAAADASPTYVAASTASMAPAAAAGAASGQNWARLAILVCAAVYGTNFAAVKTLDVSMAPSLSASLRFGLASVAALPIVYDAVRDRPFAEEDGATRMPRTLAWGAFEIGCVNALGYVCQSIGLETVDASFSAFVCSLAVVVVPLLDAVVLGKRTSRSTWVGAGLAALGVALLSLDASGLSLDMLSAPLGDVAPLVEAKETGLLIEYSSASLAGGGAPAAGLALTLVQPFCFGYGFWRTEQLLRQVGDAAACAESGACDGEILDCETAQACAISGFDLQRASLTCAALQLVAVKAAADIWLLSDVALIPLTHGKCVGLPGSPAELVGQLSAPTVLAAVAWTGLVATFATVLVETVALSKISAQESTVLFSTEPLWGASFAALTLGERLDASSFAGGALILAACLLSSLGGFPGGGNDDDQVGDLLDAIDVDAFL